MYSYELLSIKASDISLINFYPKSPLTLLILIGNNVTEITVHDKVQANEMFHSNINKQHQNM